MKQKQKNEDGDRLYYLHDIAQGQGILVLDHSNSPANIWKTQTFQNILKLLATYTLDCGSDGGSMCVFVNVHVYMCSF